MNLQSILNDMIQEGLLNHEFNENGESCYSITEKGKKILKKLEKI